MNNLLSASFIRLRKNKYFWIGFFCMLGLGAFITINSYDNTKRYGYSYTIDEIFFYYAILIGIASSAFCSLYIGTEYSDGTIRNKLIVGHTRRNIYLSNLIVCFTAGIFMILAFLFPMMTIGISLFGFFHAPLQNIIFTFFASLFMLLALTSIFTAICILIQNKAAAAVIAILGMFALLFMASYLMMGLDQPETISDYYLDESGAWQESTEIPNPHYLIGTKRAVYTTLFDILPTGQAIQYMASQTIRWELPFYSTLIIVVVTIFGILAFQRKDIK